MASIETNANRQQSYNATNRAGIGGRDGGNNNDRLSGNVAKVRVVSRKPGISPASNNDLVERLLGGVFPTAPAPAPAPMAPTIQTPKAPNQPATPAPIAPRAPAAPGSNAALPADPVVADRGAKRPDYTLLDGMRNPGMGAGQAGGRANVLSAVYRLPADGNRGVRSLQAFNGPRGERLTLGR